MGVKALKEAVQVAQDVDLEELSSVCEVLPGYSPAKENKIKTNTEQKFELPHNGHIHKQYQYLQTKKNMQYNKAVHLMETTINKCSCSTAFSLSCKMGI